VAVHRAQRLRPVRGADWEQDARADASAARNSSSTVSPSSSGRSQAATKFHSDVV
jgi:hypothetical protein